MATSIVVDAGFLVALLVRRDANHEWAVALARRLPPPWITCEAAFSEAFHLLGRVGGPALGALMTRNGLAIGYSLADDTAAVLRLVEKYADVPMSLADACLVRMTEVRDDPMLISTDSDFRIYRRHGRQVIPSVLPT
jgi:predicted nucleic acid-binding protein